MALVYVGGNSAVNTGSSYNISLTGLTGGLSSTAATGDIVIVCTAFVSQSAAPAITIAGNTSGSYINIATRGHADDTWNTEFLTAYQVMGGTPDTTVTAGRAASGSFGGGTVVHVWRGQDATTPIPQNTPTAEIINTAYADPAAVTIDNWQVIISVGAGAQDTAGSAFTVPSEIPDNNISIKGDGTISDIGVFIGSAVFTGANNDVGPCSGGSITASSSGCAISIGLREASTTSNYSLTCDAGSYSLTGQSATLSRAVALACNAGSYTFTGRDATLNKAVKLTCNAGSYTFTGFAATLTKTGVTHYSLTCDRGIYSLTGQSATLTVTRVATTPTKVGGDDVPRVEIWEKRKKQKRKDESLDLLLKKNYDNIVNTKKQVEVLEPVKEVHVELVEAIVVPEVALIEDPDDDDVEVLLLLS